MATTATRRALRAAATIAVAALATVLYPAAPASAHAYLARSAPADGAVLDRAPETLTLSFTEHVEESATTVSIVDGDGRHWAVTSIAVRASSGIGQDADPAAADAGGDDTESPVDVVVGLPAMPSNAYHISWRTLSSDDLHVTSGTVVIGVQRQVSAAAAVPGPGAPGLRESVLRAAALTGTALLLGGPTLALVMGVLARRRPGRSDPALTRGLLRLAAAGGAVAVLAVPAQLVIQVSGGGAGWSRLLWQQAGSPRWLLREFGLVLLLDAVLIARCRARASRTVVAAGVAGALLAGAGTAVLGHPMPGGPLAVLIGGLHVLAAGGWAGSVLAAALCLVPVLRREPDRAPLVREVLRAFAVVAAGCLGVLTVTGLLMTAAQVATVDALLASPYGLLLLTKIVLVAVAGLLGLGTFRRLRRTGGGALPIRRLVAEAGVLAGVLVLAAALSAAGPARGPRFPTTRIAAVPEVNGQAADLVDTVTVRPNRPGRNIVSVTVDDTRRPAPAPVTGVSLMLRGPDGTQTVHPVTRGPDGWTVTVDDIRTAGEWTVSVTVLRDGLAPATDAHRWPVPPADAAQAPVLVSTQPLQPWLTWLALLLAAGLLGGAGRYGYRAGRRRYPSTVDGPAGSAGGADADLVTVGGRPG